MTRFRVRQIQREDRRDVRTFVRLPFDIYRDIPQWVPPLLPGERARFRTYAQQTNSIQYANAWATGHQPD